MDFIPKWQSNSNAGWLTWKCMSNNFNSGVSIINELECVHSLAVSIPYVGGRQQIGKKLSVCIPFSSPKIQGAFVHLEVSTSP